MNLLSPSDIVGPSPVTSNGTETTEIEDDVADDLELDHHHLAGPPPRQSDVSSGYPVPSLHSASINTSLDVHAYHQSPGNCSSRQP